MGHWSDFLDADGPDGAYLPWKRVEPRVGISRTTAWRLQRSGDFPMPYVVSPGRVAYRESEVEAWKASRAHRSSADPPVATGTRPAACRPRSSPNRLVQEDGGGTAPVGPTRQPDLGRKQRRGAAKGGSIVRQMTFEF